MSPFHAWWRTALPETRFWTLLVEKPRAFSFCSRSVFLDMLELVRDRPVLRSKPLIRFASPIASWKSSRMNIRPAPSGLSMSFHDPVIPETSSVAPGDPGRVVGVGDRELVLRVPPGPVVEARDVVVVAQQAAVEVGEQALLVEPRDVLGRGPDQVVLRARAELDDHRLEVVVVDLGDLDAVLVLEALLQLRVHVLGPVVDQQVAVDLRLDDPPGGRAVDGPLDGAAREAVAGEGEPGAGLEELAPREPGSRDRRLRGGGRSSALEQALGRPRCTVARMQCRVTTMSPSATWTASPSIRAESSSAARSGSGPEKSPSALTLGDDLARSARASGRRARWRARRSCEVVQRPAPELDPQRPVVVTADRARRSARQAARTDGP